MVVAAVSGMEEVAKYRIFQAADQGRRVASWMFLGGFY
jgi:hypothetical protein